MGVTDGQPVNAAVTNPAFLDANADDTALGKITLANISDIPTSGPTIVNIQRELNALSSYTGKPINQAIGTIPSWTNNQVGSLSDNLFTRANALTGTFDGTIGHAHTGVDGDGPQLSGASIGGVPYAGFFLQGTLLTGVSGGSTDVTTELSGKSISTGQTEIGVVTNAPYNKVILRQGSGPNTGDEFVDGSGNVVYGRITFALLTWTLTYYVDISGTETPYSFGSSVDVDWYYQELFNIMVATPVYSPIAITPSDNTTADVIDATETLAGKVILANVAPPAIASTGAKGTSTRVAHQDHTHEGVHAILIDGDPTEALGDVSFLAGTNVTLTWNSGRLEIASTASSTTRRVERRVITAPEAAAKSLTLAYTPVDDAAVVLDVIGIGPQDNFATGDFTVSGTTLSWNGLGMDSLPIAAGDIFRIVYES
jgi:hypothetical protein